MEIQICFEVIWTVYCLKRLKCIVFGHVVCCCCCFTTREGEWSFISFNWASKENKVPIFMRSKRHFFPLRYIQYQYMLSTSSSIIFPSSRSFLYLRILVSLSLYLTLYLLLLAFSASLLHHLASFSDIIFICTKSGDLYWICSPLNFAELF